MVKRDDVVSIFERQTQRLLIPFGRCFGDIALERWLYVAPSCSSRVVNRKRCGDGASNLPDILLLFLLDPVSAY